MRKLKRRQDLSWKDLGDHIIILDSLKEKKVHHLNSVSSFVWEKLGVETDLDSLCQLICTEFDVVEDTALSDLEELILNFEKNNLLEVL